MAKPVLGHRIILRSVLGMREGQLDNIISQILKAVPVPVKGFRLTMRGYYEYQWIIFVTF